MDSPKDGSLNKFRWKSEADTIWPKHNEDDSCSFGLASDTGSHAQISSRSKSLSRTLDKTEVGRDDDDSRMCSLQEGRPRLFTFKNEMAECSNEVAETENQVAFDSQQFKKSSQTLEVSCESQLNRLPYMGPFNQAHEIRPNQLDLTAERALWAQEKKEDPSQESISQESFSVSALSTIKEMKELKNSPSNADRFLATLRQLKQLFLFNTVDQTMKGHKAEISKEQAFKLLPKHHLERLAEKRLLIVRQFTASLILDAVVFLGFRLLGTGHHLEDKPSEAGTLLLWTDFGTLLPIIALYLWSLFSRNLQIARPTLFVYFLRVFAIQVIILRSNPESIEVRMNLIRVSLGWFISQFILCLKCKIVFCLLHFAFILLSWLYFEVDEIRGYKGIGSWAKLAYTMILLVLIYLSAYLLFDLDQVENLRQFVEIHKMERETSSILNNLPSGLLVRTSSARDSLNLDKIALFNEKILAILGINDLHQASEGQTSGFQKAPAALYDKIHEPIFKLENFSSSKKRDLGSTKQLHQRRATIQGMESLPAARRSGTNGTLRTSTSPFSSEHAGKFSLASLFKTDPDELGSKIFSIVDFVDESMMSTPLMVAESSRVTENASPNAMPGCRECQLGVGSKPNSVASPPMRSRGTGFAKTPHFQSARKRVRYFQIRKHTYFLHRQLYETLQMMDVTKQVLVQNAEKQVLSQVNATVSHEMRTPINSISAQNLKLKDFAEKWEARLEEDSSKLPSALGPTLQALIGDFQDFQGCINISSSSTQQLEMVISDMLDFNSIKEKKFVKKCRQFDIKDMIENLKASSDLKASRVGVQIFTNYFDFPLANNDQAMSTGCIDSMGLNNQDFVVCADDSRIKQILNNLILNSIRFTPSGGSIFIEVQYVGSGSTQAPHGAIRFSVRDTGIGIKLEDQKNLFKLSCEVTSTEEVSSKGIGLGLHVSQLIAKQMGGKIKSTSKPMMGATFSFEVALEKPLSSSSGVVRMLSPYSRARRGAMKVGEGRILIVDDEPFNFEALKILLEKATSKEALENVDYAINGLEAIKLVKENYSSTSNKAIYSLILMDLSMPIMDGFEATDEIRNFYTLNQVGQPIIVACTGHCEQQYIEKAWRHQMDELIPKPVHYERIKAILEDGECEA